jgi:hypothetical protein
MRAVFTVVALVTVAPSVTPAARNAPIVKLEYRPTDEGMVRAVIDAECRERSLAVVIEDGRQVPDSKLIGVRSDDDDRLFDLKSENELVPFLRETVPAILKQWGVAPDGDSEWILTLRFLTFSVNEQNQPVGAMYRAVVGFDAELGRRDGSTLWRGSTDGDESRYGRKFSSDNANEVLSDALKKSLAQLFANREFRDACGGHAAAPSPAAGARVAITPAELLEEVEKLLAAGVDPSVIGGFIDRHRLTAPLSADDIIAWKAAGVPDDLVSSAIANGDRQ